MRLADLIARAGLPSAGLQDSANVTGFAIDNRKVAPGTVFGAFQGATVNGEDFIPAAIAAGAVAVVARPEARVDGALHIADANPRRAFARLAASSRSPAGSGVVVKLRFCLYFSRTMAIVNPHSSTRVSGTPRSPVS